MKLFAAIFGVILLSGCASSQKEDFHILDNRLNRLEQKITAQNGDIGQIKNDLSEVSSNASSKEEMEEVSLEVSRSLSVKDIQKALKNAGFYSGKIDGVSGAKTESAVRAFQKSKGLKVDGKVGNETSRRLQRYL